MSKTSYVHGDKIQFRITILKDETVWHDGLYIAPDTLPGGELHIIQVGTKLIYKLESNIRHKPKMRIQHSGYIGVMSSKANGHKWATPVWSSREEVQGVVKKLPNSDCLDIIEINWTEEEK